MPLDLWLAFVAATTALLLIPGPTVLLVLSYALSKGRSVAVAMLFAALKWVGAAYLVWLGIKLLRSAPSEGLEARTANRDVTASGVFRHAAVVTALNPKSIAFFIAFVPQFVRPDAPLAPQFAILIATFVGLAGLNALAYALLADRLRTTIGRPRVITGLTRAGGVTLIGMGVLTALLRRPAG